MAEDPGEDTRLIPINGRQIVVRELLPAQAILIMRLIRNLRRDLAPDADRAVIINNTAKILDIIESAVVQQSDRDYLEDLIVERKLDLKELVGVVTAFREDEDEEKPKVRRGRPRKTQPR